MIPRYDIINFLTAKFEQCRYLEIGSYRHECFSKIEAAVKDDIDPNGEARIAPVFKMTSDEFFSTHAYELTPGFIRRRIYDVIFIDGLHLCEQVLKDVLNSSRHLSQDGYIVLHDCLPEKEEYQGREQTSHVVWNGDVWKAQAWLVEQFENVMTIKDSDCGCGIINGKVEFELPSINKLLKYEWSDFSNELLRVVDWNEYKSRKSSNNS